MLKNVETCNQIIESIDTLHEAIYEIYSISDNRLFTELLPVLDITRELLEGIHKALIPLYSEDDLVSKINNSIVDNALASIDTIIRLSRVRSPKLLDKIEFELLPIVRLLYFTFYYIAFIEDEEYKTEEFINGVGNSLYTPDSMKTSLETGEYKYDVSILVVGYNKLDYTKMCLESILKHTPAHINYELILLNHGSTDGTKEYFESVGCTKQIDLSNNGLSKALVFLASESKFQCVVSNDVLVGENYLDNILACFESDPDVQYIVPTTTNISNLQSIVYDFNSLDDMEKFAKANNQKDPYRWEQRCRLIDPIAVFRSDFFYRNNIFLKSCLRLRENAFGDDYLSLCVRRAGGKCVLAKDSFCYHFGSITMKEDNDYNKTNNFQEGRLSFLKKTGVDPWGPGFCYDINLFEALPCTNDDEVKVLGINCGLGSNPLKIKEQIKEKVHNNHVKIYNLTSNKAYEADLNGVSDYVETFSTLNEIKTKFDNTKFNYIICESNEQQHSRQQLLIDIMKKRLAANGILCSLGMKINGAKSVSSNLYPHAKWFVYEKQ